MFVRAEDTNDVAQFTNYGMYLPRTDVDAGLYVQSPISARGGIINDQGTALEIVAIKSIDLSDFGGPILNGAVDGNAIVVRNVPTPFFAAHFRGARRESHVQCYIIY